MHFPRRLPHRLLRSAVELECAPAGGTLADARRLLFLDLAEECGVFAPFGLQRPSSMTCARISFVLSGVRLRLRTCRAAFRSESFFSGDPPDSGAGLGVSTSSSASGAADSASGSVAGTASGVPGSAMTRSILVTMNSRLLPTFLTFQPFAVISVTTTSISLRPTFTMTMVPTVMLLVSHILTSFWLFDLRLLCFAGAYTTMTCATYPVAI